MGERIDINNENVPHDYLIARKVDASKLSLSADCWIE